MDEILNLIESVSEGFPSYFFILREREREGERESKRERWREKESVSARVLACFFTIQSFVRSFI